MPGGLHPPLTVVLTWPTPNLKNPESRPNSAFYLACIGGSITTVLSFTRLWVRIFHQRNPGWDDWIMLASIVPMIAVIVLLGIASIDGFNHHVWDLDHSHGSAAVVRSRKYVLAIECLFCVAAGLLKISILLFYRRLSSRVVSKVFRYTTWATIAFIIAYTVILTIVPIVGCRPISAFWDQVSVLKKLKGYEYHCFDEGADVLTASIISASQDLITAILPTFLYWNLQIPIRQKFALFGIFAIGYGVVALGGLRAYYTWRTFYVTYDVTWSTWDLLLTTLLELQLGCFCANAPALKVFFRYFLGQTISSLSRSKPSNGEYSSHASGSRSTKWSTDIANKMASLFTNSSSNSKGYISEAHNSVTVDHHGGVIVQRDVHVTYSPPQHAHERHTSAISDAYDQGYSDIEMGCFNTGHDSFASNTERKPESQDTDLSALPTMPVAPKRTKSLSSIKSPAYLLPSHVARSTSNTPNSQNMLQDVEEESTGRPRAGTPLPNLSLNRQTRPAWQSWT